MSQHSFEIRVDRYLKRRVRLLLSDGNQFALHMLPPHSDSIRAALTCAKHQCHGETRFALDRMMCFERSDFVFSPSMIAVSVAFEPL